MQSSVEPEIQQTQISATEHLIKGIEGTAKKATHFNNNLENIVTKMNMLSLNALIQAANSGEAGRGFGVVAQEMKKLAEVIKDSSNSFTDDVVQSLRHRVEESQSIDKVIVGSRFADLALNLIDIIDRNLYERTCDVRWWATDSAVVGAKDDPALASHRLGVILDSYTVYHDLWIIEPNGKVLTNGLAEKFNVQDHSVAQEGWFKQALATKDGSEYAVGQVHINPYLNGAVAIPYAAAIREKGEEQGRIIGVIAVMMNWSGLADEAIAQVRLSDNERNNTQCYVVDKQGQIIAPSTHPGFLKEALHFDHKEQQGYLVTPEGLTAQALTPGYETYPGLGWRAVICQES